MGRRFSRLAMSALPILFARAALAIVLMPGDPGVPADSRPDDAVVGQWGHNGSAVAIDPNHILCVSHCGGGEGTLVRFGGISYRVTRAVPVGLADLRVCRISRLDGSEANLTQYANIYCDTDELNQNVVIGGFGQGRGKAILDETGRGYQWDGSDNTRLRWGCNRIQLIVPNRRIRDSLNDLAICFFDAPSYAAHLDHEAGLAEFDSGCGWFLHTDSGWKVAAIGVGTQRAGRSLCSPPDAIVAIRLTRYAQRIAQLCRDETDSPQPASSSQAMIAAFDPALPWLSGWGALTFLCIGLGAARRRRRAR